MRRAISASLLGFILLFRRSRRQYLLLLGLLCIGLCFIFHLRGVVSVLWQTLATLPEQSLSANPHLYRRELLFSEPWPEVEGIQWSPTGNKNAVFDTLAPTNSQIGYQAFPIASVHMVWCGRNRRTGRYSDTNRTSDEKTNDDTGIFRFENHLALLSIIRILKPMRVVVHYREPPRTDSLQYHTWWEELRQSVPTLILRPSDSELDLACERPSNVMSSSPFWSFFDSSSQNLHSTLRSVATRQRAFLTFILRQLARENGGGAWIGDSTVLTRLPQEMTSPSQPSNSKTSFYSKDLQETFFYYITDQDGMGKEGKSVGSAPEFPSDISQGFIVTRSGFDRHTIKKKVVHILNTILETHKNIGEITNSARLSDDCSQDNTSRRRQPQCISAEEYNFIKMFSSSLTSSTSPPCLVLRQSIYPHNIWEGNSRFSDLARWLLYGERKRRKVTPSTFYETSPKPKSSSPPLSSLLLSKSPPSTLSSLSYSPTVSLSQSLQLSTPPPSTPLSSTPPSPCLNSCSDQLIPRVHHMIWTRSNLPWPSSNRFTFIHYLSALSALYVAGASTLLIHGDVEPSGKWWDLLIAQKLEQTIQDIHSVSENFQAIAITTNHNVYKDKALGYDITSPNKDAVDTIYSLHENLKSSLPDIGSETSISTKDFQRKSTLSNNSDSSDRQQHKYNTKEKDMISERLDTVRLNNLTSTHRKTVKFVRIGPEPLDSIFQQEVVLPAHRSDVIRLLILLKYGGVYQDRDVIWTRRIPTSLRRYSAVVSNDWPRYGEWPGSFNLGVLLARPGSEYLKRLLESFRQTICFMDICHPTWHPDYIRPLEDMRPINDFQWWQSRSIHFTFPKTPASLASPKTVRHGTDMAAEVARMVLKASGQSHLLDSESDS
ncbi:glycosyltransferase sugar-binding region containing DXD motif-containing protein [Elysia marginata]|uniref:Glycosyltransferase sugar-binding region containing DXD motif-containing protein n=1 Tax=Elysia marginata TaxID=1093978 RepID=A0AAV4GV22_9GAST|nr:glycosyltransferase sugar-binding region containing DXD motif-containing protein [Elysia marginata]